VHVGEEGGSRYLEIDQRSKVWYCYAGTIIGDSPQLVRLHWTTRVMRERERERERDGTRGELGGAGTNIYFFSLCAVLKGRAGSTA